MAAGWPSSILPGLVFEHRCRSTSCDQESREEYFLGSFNGRVREEWLSLHSFTSLAEAQTIIEI